MRNTFGYNHAIKKLRDFFQNKKQYIEVPVQSRLSILAACEDPKTIANFYFNDTKYPLPQTGQMWLEYEILKNSDVPGFFCISTSYRDEPNPITGRHDKIFPMFEFECRGGISELKKLEAELLSHLGFPKAQSKNYHELSAFYKVDELSHKEEEKLAKDFSRVVSLENFPEHTHPFWNMKHNKTNDIYNKIDVILHGMETIGSAERETDVAGMRERFYTISNGEYAKLLFDSFGKTRVEEELEEYLALPMVQRFGGGIGVTRLVRAMQLEEKITQQHTAVEYS